MNLGQIVTITDLRAPMTGVITLVTRTEGVTIYQVTTLTGTRWAREESDLAPAAEGDAAEFVRDVKILAPHHADLAEAFAQVIAPTDQVVPGTRLLDIPISQTLTGGRVVTRREVAAEMVRTAATAPAPSSIVRAVRSVTETV